MADSVAVQVGPWQDFAALDQSMPAGPWADYGQPSGTPPPATLPGGIAPQQPGQEPGLWQTFVGGYKEGYGDTPPMRQQDFDWFVDHGIFKKGDDDNGVLGTLRGFAQNVIYAAAGTADAATRFPGALYRGLQAAGMQLGLPGDIMSMPDAFMGSPHPTGIPHVDAILAEPEVKAAIDNGPVNRANHVPYEAGASDGSDPTTNIDKSIPETANLPGGQSFDTATPLKIHEQVEKFVMQKLTAGGMSDEDAYKVAHWEYAEKAEDAWYAAQGIDPAAAEKWWTERASHIEHEPTADTPADLYDKPYPHDSVALARSDTEATQKPDDALIGKAQDILGKSATDFGQGIRDFFQARDLGVIGGDRPPTDDMPPPDAARSMAASRAGDDVLKGPEPEGQRSWQARFDQFVGKLTAPDDIKGLIRDAAKENGDFMPARMGEIPLAQLDGIARAAGIEPSELNARGLGRLLKNDNEVRIAMQGMMAATEQVKQAARDVKTDGSPDNLIKLQAAMMRRDMAVEGVVGLRAEWGRTGNVFQEFMENVKDAQALGEFLKDKGRTPGDLRDIADAIDNLGREDAARTLNELRKPQMGPLYYTWVNSLIAGILSHVKYIAANALYSVIEHGVVTPIAALIGKARSIAGVGDVDRVFFGDAVAANYGMLAAVPTSFIAAARSVRAGMRLPLESEIEVRKAMLDRGEKVPATIARAVENAQQERPIPGVWGRIIGSPGDMAGGIHSFFKVLGERAGIEEQAYHAAIKEGLSPADARFWSRRAEIAANPTEAMRVKAIEGAYKGTFMQDLGPRAKAWQNVIRKVPGLRWAFPFSHIPVNLLKATYEHTPLAILDTAMRDDIAGKNGGVAQDKAIARMVAGSAVMGYFAHLYMNGQATGDLPADPKERRAFYMSGKQPNSILIGDHWVSYQRFGPAGDLAALGTSIGSVAAAAQDGEDGALERATAHAAVAAVHLVADEVGFMTLQNIFEAVMDPDHRGAQFVSSEVSTLLPFSSLIGQTASFMDPDMREAKTIIDGLKYRIPGARETLLPKRDWNGREIANPQHGNIIRQTTATPDPVDAELLRLGVTPAPAQDRIAGIKLSPEQYDEYVATAGPLVESLLTARMNDPGYQELPRSMQAQQMRKLIALGREQARYAMQARHPELWQQALIERRQDILSQ